MTSFLDTIQDPVGTLVRYMQENEDLKELLTSGSASIYGDAIPPRTEAEKTNILVFRAAGGSRADSSLVTRPRIEVRAYGETDALASRVYWITYAHLHRQENIVVGQARILSIMFDGGGAALFDQTLNTPFKLGFFNMWFQLFDP